MTQKPEPDYVFNVYGGDGITRRLVGYYVPARSVLALNNFLRNTHRITHRIIVRLKDKQDGKSDSLTQCL